MNYKILIYIIILIIFISSASADSLNIDGMANSPNINGNIITDTNNFKYQESGDGLYKITYEEKKFLGITYSSSSTYFGFGISGKINNIPFINFPTDLNWKPKNIITENDIKGKKYILTQSVIDNSLKTDIDFSYGKTKITNTFTNKYQDNITDSKFYYFFTISDSDEIKYNSKNLNRNAHERGNLNNIIPQFMLNDILVFNYHDIISTGYNITDIYIISAKELGFNSNEKLVTIVFSRGNRNISVGETVVIDPSLEQNGGSITLRGNYTYDYVNLTNGGILYVAPYNGTVGSGMLNITINYDLNIDSTSSINGDSGGFRGGAGGNAANCNFVQAWTGDGGIDSAPGAGTGGGGGVVGEICSGGGGGGAGSYGTTGGSGGYGGGTLPPAPGSGGSIYGTSNLRDISMGSGGGGGGGAASVTSGSSGNPGGASLTINARNANIQGTVTFNGGNGGGGGVHAAYPDGGGGGGASGGGILINASAILNINSGTIIANGGSGGAGGADSGAGASGGGGRIKLFFGLITNTSTTISAGTTYYEDTNSVPTVPVLTTHANYHTGGSTTVTWSASTDAQGDPITYDVKVGTSSGGTNILNYAGDTDTTSNAFTMTPQNNYYWSVRACDLIACSAYATESSFLFTNSVPTVPVLTTHANYHNPITTTVNWSVSTDTDSDTITYYYNIGTSSGGTNVANNLSASTTGSIGFLLVVPNTYYWKARACDSYGCSSYASESTFIFTNNLPSVPVITNPINNTVSYINTTTNINWTQSTDADGDSVNYTWQFSNVSNFAYILNTSTTANLYSGNITYALWSQYYVRVKANDNKSYSSDYSSVVNFTSARLFIMLTPENGSTSIPNYVNLTWTEFPKIAPYSYEIGTDPTFSTTLSSGSTTNFFTDNFNLVINTKYYWRVKNATSGFTTVFNFTTAATSSIPGGYNISVFDENNLSKVILNFTAQVYNTTSVVTVSTTTGWANFTGNQLINSEYLIIVTPEGSFSNYYPRMVLSTSPNNVTMYVPNGTSPNNINLVTFSLLDVTGRFPYKTSILTVTKGGLVIEKSYFSVDGTHSVYLLQNNNYQLSVQNGSNIFVGNNFISTGTGTSTITINDFSVNTISLNPFIYNITYNPSQIILNWNDVGGVLSQLNFTVHQGTSFLEYCQQTTSLSVGQIVCGIDNTTQYHVIFSASITDGTFQNTSFVVDYTYGKRKSSQGTSTVDGSPIGIGFVWNYGTFTMPDWVYNWGSLILVILLAGSFGGYHSGFGGIITIFIALLLELKGLFRPLGDNDPDNLITMGITGGLFLLAIAYYLQHKDRGG